MKVGVLTAMLFLALAGTAQASTVRGFAFDPRGDFATGFSGEPADIKSMSVRMNEAYGRLVVRFRLYKPVPSPVSGEPAVYPEAGVSCDEGFIDLRNSFAIIAVGESQFPTVPLEWDVRGRTVTTRVSDPRIAGLGCHTATGFIAGSGGPVDGSMDSVDPFPLN